MEFAAELATEGDPAGILPFKFVFEGFSLRVDMGANANPSDDVGPPPTSPLPPRPGKSLQSGLRHLFSKHGKEYGNDADRRAGRVIVEPGMGDNAWLGSLR